MSADATSCLAASTRTSRLNDSTDWLLLFVAACWAGSSPAPIRRPQNRHRLKGATRQGSAFLIGRGMQRTGYGAYRTNFRSWLQYFVCGHSSDQRV